MTVMGYKVAATYDLSVEGNPRSMLVKMDTPTGMNGGPPPPPVPYIFRFESNDELWFCHPVDSPDLPQEFKGPGFTKYRRNTVVPEVLPSEPLEVRVVRYLR